MEAPFLRSVSAALFGVSFSRKVPDWAATPVLPWPSTWPPTQARIIIVDRTSTGASREMPRGQRETPIPRMLHGRQPPSLADELKSRTERRARQNQGYRAGSTSNVSSVALIRPPMTTVASGRCTSAPEFIETAIGRNH
jgi:hypothetical protein